MKVYLLILIILVTCSQIVHSQDNCSVERKNYPGIVASYGYGKVLPTNGFVEGDNMAGSPIDHFQSFSLKFVWQNPGYTDWQRIYNVPYWGFGFILTDLFNPDEIGHPVSFYGVLGLPIKRWEKLEVYS